MGAFVAQLSTAFVSALETMPGIDNEVSTRAPMATWRGYGSTAPERKSWSLDVLTPEETLIDDTFSPYIGMRSMCLH